MSEELMALTEKFHADHRVMCPHCQDADAINEGHKEAVRDLTAELTRLRTELNEDYDPIEWLRAKRASEVERLMTAANNAYGILKANLGDSDPHVRSACDLLSEALRTRQ